MQLNLISPSLRARRRPAGTVNVRLKGRAAGFLLAAGVALAGSSAATLAVTVPARAAGFDAAAAEAQLISDINADRAANGKGAVLVNPTLSNIARSGNNAACGGAFHGRSQDMIERGYFSHQIPPCGSFVWPILQAYGVQYSSAGENIGWNNYIPQSTSVDQINTQFMASPGHRANLLGDYNQVGVGAFAAPGNWFYNNQSYAGVIMFTEIFTMGPPPVVAPPPPPPPVMTQTDALGVTGSDNQAWAREGSTGFEPLGGQLVGAPAVIRVYPVAGGPSTLLYVGTGQDHYLWVRSTTQGWQRLSASSAVYCVDNPAVSAVQQTLYVSCQGGDHALWYASGTIGAQLPFLGGWQSLGGLMVSGPASAQLPGDSGPTFVVDGVDGAVYSRTLTTAWQRLSWRCIGHPAVAGSGAGTAYFACHGIDGQLWAATTTGGAWSAARPMGGALVDGVAVSLRATGAAYYVQGVDGQVWGTVVSNGVQGVWGQVGGQVLYGVGSTSS